MERGVTQSADDKVSEKIIGTLRDRRLVIPSRIDDLSKRLRSGRLTSTDWRRIAEASLDEEEQQAEDAHPN